jgi:transglutaminase-like putative cysteine protease
MTRHDSGPAPAECLAPTRLIDSEHPDIAATAAKVTAGARDDVERAVRLHDFVRDRILFGWAPAFERQKASEVLKSGIGFCNTKSTLFAALLRASHIPARVRFKTINRRILDGLIRPPQPFVDHSYVEAWLDGRWVGTDSYAVDSALQRAAVARCRAEGKRIGYGVHTGGTTQWDGRSNAFTQLNDDGSVPDLTDSDFGSFIDLEAFRATGRGRSPTHLPARLGIRLLLPAANRRVERLRAS